MDTLQDLEEHLTLHDLKILKKYFNKVLREKAATTQSIYSNDLSIAYKYTTLKH